MLYRIDRFPISPQIEQRLSEIEPCCLLLLWMDLQDAFEYLARDVRFLGNEVEPAE